MILETILFSLTLFVVPWMVFCWWMQNRDERRAATPQPQPQPQPPACPCGCARVGRFCARCGLPADEQMRGAMTAVRQLEAGNPVNIPAVDWKKVSYRRKWDARCGRPKEPPACYVNEASRTIHTKNVSTGEVLGF